MGGIKPMFTQATIKKQLVKFQSLTTEKAEKAFAYLGEEIVNDAKSKGAEGSFIDRTGNLRSSEGYEVKTNGKSFVKKVEQSSSGDEGGKGVKAGKQLLSEIKSEGDIQLTVVAGMDYALWVESMKGKNVLSASIPKKSEIEKTLKELLG